MSGMGEVTFPRDDYQHWLDGLVRDPRFGARDKLGTANFLDDAARRRGAASVVTGAAVSLARPLQEAVTPGFAVDVHYTDGPIGAGTDHVEYDCHGRDLTHLDALNHIAIDRTWYGGTPVDDPESPSVAALAAHGLVTRGVLVDVPARRGTDWVNPDEPVAATDIDGALADAGVAFEPGDALLVYMGRDRFEAAGGVFGDLRGGEVYPGIGRTAAEWIVRHDAALLGWDFLDSNHPSEPFTCVHRLNWAIGLVLVDNCDLAPAAAALRAAGRVTGCLTVAPIAVPGGTGSVVNPVLVL